MSTYITPRAGECCPYEAFSYCRVACLQPFSYHFAIPLCHLPRGPRPSPPASACPACCPSGSRCFSAVRAACTPVSAFPHSFSCAHLVGACPSASHQTRILLLIKVIFQNPSFPVVLSRKIGVLKTSRRVQTLSGRGARWGQIWKSMKRGQNLSSGRGSGSLGPWVPGARDMQNNIVLTLLGTPAA